MRLLDALRDTSARVLTQERGSRCTEHLHAVREELLSGDTEWDRKVEAVLAQYEHLARENAQRQEALREAREARAVAETFAAMGDVAANLLHHLNNQVGTIPARVEGIQDKCADLIARSPYLRPTWPKSNGRRSTRCRPCATGSRCCGPSRPRRSTWQNAWPTRYALPGCRPGVDRRAARPARTRSRPYWRDGRA